MISAGEWLKMKNKKYLPETGSLRTRMCWQFFLILFPIVALSTGCARPEEAIYSLSEAMPDSRTASSDLPDAMSSSASLGFTGASGASAASDPSDRNEKPVQQSHEVIYIDVSGAVRNPGVYTLSPESRVYEAIEAAGGMTEEAEPKVLNQARLLKDGEKITVYTRAEIEEGKGPAAEASAGHGIPADETAGDGRESSLEPVSGKVNLNQADKNLLMTLPGIGEVKAEAILRYREEKGGFRSIEEIQQISGIKSKAFEKIKDRITV